MSALPLTTLSDLARQRLQTLMNDQKREAAARRNGWESSPEMKKNLELAMCRSVSKSMSLKSTK